MTDKVVVKVEDKVTTFVTPDQGPVGPSGESLIDGKSVQVSSISDGDVISYSLADNEWQNKTLPAISLTDATTDDLTEGASSLYYTDARVNADIDARVNKTFVDALNVNADTLDGQDSAYYLDYNNLNNTPTALSQFSNDENYIKLTDITVSGDLSYNSSTGEISFTERTSSDVRALFGAEGDLSYDRNSGKFSITKYGSSDFNSDFSAKTTDDLSEGLSSKYYADFRVDSHLSGGTGVTYNTGEISIGQDVSVNSSVSFNSVSAQFIDCGTIS